MPNIPDEILTELVRNSSALVCELLRASDGIDLRGLRGQVEAVDLSRIVPPKYHVDHVTVFRDGDEAKLAVVVQIQREIDRAKLYTWPVYVTAVFAVYDCPTALLVIAPEQEVAQWARKPIELGPKGFGSTMQPIVVSFDEVPRVVDEAEARRNPELAVLSVLAHRGLAEARATVAALNGLSTDKSRRYLDLVMAALPEVMQAELTRDLGTAPR